MPLITILPSLNISIVYLNVTTVGGGGGGGGGGVTTTSAYPVNHCVFVYPACGVRRYTYPLESGASPVTFVSAGMELICLPPTASQIFASSLVLPCHILDLHNRTIRINLNSFHQCRTCWRRHTRTAVPLLEFCLRAVP